MEPSEFWDRCHGAYDALNNWADYTAGLDALVGELDVAPGRSVLDAGSGTGNFALRLEAAGANVVGMDFSPIALRRHVEKAPRARVVRGSLEAPLPFADGRFDRVACLSVLFALSRSGARLALREFRRVLKPGGALLVSVMKPRQSKAAAFAGHVRKRYRAQPLGGFVREMGRTLWPVLRVVYYNYLMYTLARRDGYRRFTHEELRSEVAAAGFVDLEYGTTFGGRFHVIRARRPGIPGASGEPGREEARAVRLAGA